MAKYTVELRKLLQDEHTKALIDNAMSKYPLYESKSKQEYIPVYIPTREELNTMILNHYRYREIGFETVGRFIEELEYTLNEIMPYYNQLYMTTDLDYEILFNVNYEKSIVVDRDGTQTANANSSSQGINKVTSSDSTNGDSYNKSTDSDTPQSQLTITNKNIDSVDYASSVQFGHSTTETNGTSESNSNSDVESSSTGTTINKDKEMSTEITKGNYGQVSYQSLIRQYRELITNVTKRIIEDREIASLFMLIY
jgi:hypothetical protein